MRSKSFAPLAISILLVFFIAPYLVLGLFNQPQNDDFAFAAQTQIHGYLGANQFWYQSWVGRYSSTALLCLLSPDMDIVLAAKVTAIFVLISLFAAAVFFCRHVFGVKDPAGSLLFGAAITALYLLDMPDLVEGVYWMSGALTYQTGNILVLVICGLIAKRYNVDSPGKTPLLFFCITVASIVAIGTNEVTMLLVFFVFALSGAYSLFRRKVKPLLLYGAALSALFSLIVVFAPGTRARLAYSQHNDFFLSLAMALKQCAVLTGTWLLTTPVLPVAFLLIRFLPRESFLLRFIDSRRRLVSFVLVSLLLLAALFFPSYYGTGTMEPRTLNVMFLCFTLVVFVSVFSLVYLADTQAVTVRLATTPGARIFLLLVSLITLLPPSSNNLLNVYAQLLNGSAYSYNAELNRRYQTIRASGYSICLVPPLKNPPSTLFFFENAVDRVNDDQGMVSYKNSYARYFGKSLVVLAN